jgi:hypothetical protein
MTLVVAGAATPEQRADARDVARREKALAAELAHDRRDRRRARLHRRRPEGEKPGS